MAAKQIKNELRRLSLPMYEEMMLEEGWDSYDWFLKMEAVERYEFAINTLKMPKGHATRFAAWGK